MFFQLFVKMDFKGLWNKMWTHASLARSDSIGIKPSYRMMCVHHVALTAALHQPTPSHSVIVPSVSTHIENQNKNSEIYENMLIHFLVFFYVRLFSSRIRLTVMSIHIFLFSEVITF